VEPLGTIEPGADLASGKPEWIRLSNAHPQLSPVPAREGVNPFSRDPHLYEARPDTARVLLELRQVGLIHWAMDDSRRLIVWADTGSEEKVGNVAQDVASRPEAASCRSSAVTQANLRAPLAPLRRDHPATQAGAKEWH
jgi:hypothetical protein